MDVREALLKLIEAAEQHADKLSDLASSADDRGAAVIESDAMRWRQLARDGLAAIRETADK
jgi:hypothetical protein